MEADCNTLIETLETTTGAERAAVRRELETSPPEDVLGGIADLLLETEDAELRETCLGLFSHFGASIDMAEHQAAGWYEQLTSQISQFDSINNVLGDRFLAYSFILGIQIRSLMLDGNSPINTAVHFTLNDDEVQVLSLGEFKLRVIQALLTDQRKARPPALPFEPDAALDALGPKHLLLAPLFDVAIERILLAGLEPTSPRHLVLYREGETPAVEDLRKFLGKIRSRLRQELSGMAENPFTIDLMAVPKARDAFEKGQYTDVIQILSSWPGLLSVLQRTPVVRQLDPEQLDLIGEGICLLGEALEIVEKGTWSEALYKLGLMIVRDGPSAGRLLWHFGRGTVEKGEFGMAIGLLKRSMALGYDESTVLPLLGRAFLKQGKVVAARALLERASREAVESPDLEADLAEVREIFDRADVPWGVPDAVPVGDDV